METLGSEISDVATSWPDADKCMKLPEHTVFVLNIAIHVIILFGILSIFFRLVVSPMAKTDMDEQVRGNVSSAVATIIKNEKSKIDSLGKTYTGVSGTIHSALGSVPGLEEAKNTAGDAKQETVGLLDRAAEHYKNPSPIVNEWNSWLFTTNALVWVAMAAAVVGMVLVLHFGCNSCPTIPTLAMENLIVFAMVGVVEFGFFKLIASKYIPTKPSAIVEDFKNSVVRNF